MTKKYRLYAACKCFFVYSTVKLPGNQQEIALGQGFAEVVNNRVTLIVDTAERPEDIDVRHAQEQRERAEEQMRQKQSIQQYYHTQASLARAMNRLRLAQDKKWNL